MQTDVSDVVEMDKIRRVPPRELGRCFYEIKKLTYSSSSMFRNLLLSGKA